MDNSDIVSTDADKLLELSTKIIVAYVSNNTLNSDALPDVIKTVHSTLNGLHKQISKGMTTHNNKPAVPINKSITDEYIICLEDGKKLKMLKRYLRSRYDLTPQDYRRKWGLPSSYPMVSPNYAARRSIFAKQIGLGKKSK